MTSREEHIQKVHERIQEKLKAKHEQRANRPAPTWQQPRYDEVFEQGMNWLDADPIDYNGNEVNEDAKTRNE